MSTKDRWPRGRMNSLIFTGSYAYPERKRRGPDEVNASIDRKLAAGRREIERELGVKIRVRDL